MVLLLGSLLLSSVPSSLASPEVVAILSIIGLFVGILLILFSKKLRTTDAKRLRRLSIYILILAIISNIYSILNLGFILAFIGGILGYFYSRKNLNKAPLAPFILALIGGLIVFFISLVPVLFLFGI